MAYDDNQRGYEDEPRGYDDRDRSRSPRGERLGDGNVRTRSASPNHRDRMESCDPSQDNRQDDESARNPGSNLFVTGIHPLLSEEEVSRLFEKYGDVEKCNIMRDPHTRESRGFGFVKMVTPEQADAAKEGLQGEVYEGRTLSIEKARRARPRTPTPGKYYGPPKRDDFRGSRGGRYAGRYDDRRGGSFGRREEHGYRSSRYRFEDRDSKRRDRDTHYNDYRNVDSYPSGREDRYPRDRDEYRSGYYEREVGRGSSFGDSRVKNDHDSYDGGRSYDDRGDDRYSRR